MIHNFKMLFILLTTDTWPETRNLCTLVDYWYL